MRKTQVALAALALVASTAAMADVAVYGALDVGVVSNSNGTSLFGAGNSNTSLFGLKGGEDLGGGLKAGFNLEGGINGATGATGANGGISTSLFNRAANVSLSTEAVGVTLGTQISPFITGVLTGVTGVGGNGAFVPALLRLDGGSVGTYTTDTTATDMAAAGNTGGFFISNAVNLNVNGGGLSANLLYRSSKTGSDYTAANVTTSVSGINLALAYQSIKAVAATTGTDADPANNAVTSNDDRTSTAIAANTTVAGVRLNAAYSSNKIASASHSGYLIGASMPVAGALSAGLTYSHSGLSAIGNATTASLQYDLSKATYAYLNYSSFSLASTGGLSANDNSLAAAKSLLAVGLAHSF